MTHHAKALPAKWAGKTLLSLAAPPAKAAHPSGYAAHPSGYAAVAAFGIALRYLALKRDAARRDPAPPRPALRPDLRPDLRIVT